ncbi:MAG: hypothetical protein KKI08_18830 [Armatimonadetes bacterium]|nr:hypothetical protein [Armatimonadota bacterium]
MVDETGEKATSTPTGTSTGTATGTSSTTHTTTHTGSTTGTTTPACLAFDEFCDCWAVNGCEPVGAGCLCHCDYSCPGEPPCDCNCGGGDYLGCAAIDCPVHEFPPDSQVAFGPDGCPYLVD